MSGFEAVAAAASIIQVADFGLRISKTIYAYTDLVKSADKRLKNLAEHVQLTSDVVRYAGDLFHQCKIVDAGEKEVRTAMQCVSTCETAFIEIEKDIEKARLTPLQRKSKLRFPFRERKFELMDARLEKLKSSLHFMLSIVTNKKPLKEAVERKGQIQEKDKELLREVETLRRAQIAADSRYQELQANYNKLLSSMNANKTESKLYGRLMSLSAALLPHLAAQTSQAMTVANPPANTIDIMDIHENESIMIHPMMNSPPISQTPIGPTASELDARAISVQSHFNTFSLVSVHCKSFYVRSPGRPYPRMTPVDCYKPSNIQTTEIQEEWGYYGRPSRYDGWERDDRWDSDEESPATFREWVGGLVTTAKSWLPSSLLGTESPHNAETTPIAAQPVHPDMSSSVPSLQSVYAVPTTDPLEFEYTVVPSERRKYNSRSGDRRAELADDGYRTGSQYSFPTRGELSSTAFKIPTAPVSEAEGKYRFTEGEIEGLDARKSYPEREEED
ncbi:hypothetical protein K469DRAFT_681409 [Zopfia rhizophila CBS 207.26]|uniref:Fungal N-terminal domain-containing protein n=1 Tax=Zopfia rhizophila CBS 207.26 TaxID=1314779 RepID=A0A6A6ETZ4_9PEZI|nr:hypothetical protein K469DRAFT_681409 [Zopfia rhizophila CBS 207.26]